MDNARDRSPAGGEASHRFIARPDPLDAVGSVLRNAFGGPANALPPDMQALLDRLRR